jgi:hypothetical protein
MKIVRPNGTILELTTDEYRQLFGEKRKDISFTMKVPRIAKESPTKEAVREYMRNYTRERRKLKTLKTFKHKCRKSSCKHWERRDIKLLLDSKDKSISQLRKMFPERSKCAIRTLLYKHGIKHCRGYNPYKKVTKTDGRKTMMKFISKERARIRAKNPTISFFNAQKEAMNRYRTFKGYM